MDLKDKRKIVESFSSSLNRNISRYKIQKNRIKFCPILL